jgi:hypothetical protein
VLKFKRKFQGGRVNPLTTELNPYAQSCLPRFLLGILIFKGLTARRFYKSFGVKELNLKTGIISLRVKLPTEIFLLGIVIFKGLTSRRLYKSFGFKRLIFPIYRWLLIVMSVQEKEEIRFRKHYSPKRLKSIYTLLERAVAFRCVGFAIKEFQ